MYILSIFVHLSKIRSAMWLRIFNVILVVVGVDTFLHKTNVTKILYIVLRV